MYTLTYESVAVSKMSDREMGTLLAKSRAYNDKRGITGCLVYYRGRFVQVIEGAKTEVEQLFEKIGEDRRHRDVNLFSEDEIAERSFPGWGMAYYPIDEDLTNKQELEQFKRNLLLLSDFVEPRNVTAILFWKRMKYLISLAPLDNR